MASGDFDTHLLSMEEVWFIRENPVNIVSVKARAAVRAVEEAEELLAQRRAVLDAAVTALDKRMNRKNDR